MQVRAKLVLAPKELPLERRGQDPPVACSGEGNSVVSGALSRVRGTHPS
jgi:hypothetical protein